MNPDSMLMKGCVRRWISRCAFTLVEVLLAMAILAMIVIGSAQMINSTSVATLRTGKQMDCDTQARLIMDRIGADLASAIKRPDVDIYFNQSNGNDGMYFFCQANGYYASSESSTIGVRNTVSLAGYRVNNGVSSGQTFELERLSRGLHWANTGTGASSGQPATMIYLPELISTAFATAIADPYNNSTNLAPSSSTNAPEWDVIGNLVFRFEYCFLLKNTPGSAPNGYTPNSGKLSLVPYDTSAGHSSENGLQDVEAVVITFALLDSKSRTIINGKLAPLVNVFPDADGTNSTADVWTKIVNKQDASRPFPPAGIPASVGAEVKIYQRYFYLNSYITN